MIPSTAPQPQTSRSATLLVICVAHFLMPFMMSAVGVALPTLGREMHASALQLGLVETTYVLSASIFLLAMGRLGDIHGRRRIFQYGIVIFTLIGGLLSTVAKRFCGYGSFDQINFPSPFP